VVLDKLRKIAAVERELLALVMHDICRYSVQESALDGQYSSGNRVRQAYPES
jgi:hypothetical protein